LEARLPRPLAAAALLAALSGTACTPTLFMNRSFLVPEELKLSPTGYASLKSTGETFDLTPLKQQEPALGDRVLVLEVHGSYVLIGEGWKHAWRIWPSGKDEAKYKPLDLKATNTPDGGTFRSPTLEASGNCALLKWQQPQGPAQAFITADGDFAAQKCGE
jgi:hypothetical protein